MSNEQIHVYPEKDLTIRQGQAPAVFEYRGFQYTADSVNSLVDLVESKGSTENTVISYNEAGIQVILDDTVVDRKQDRISYGFKYSVQSSEWKEILNGAKSFNQKELLQFLQRREAGEVLNSDKLVAALQQLRYVTNITGDFSQTDSNNYTFMIKVGEAKGSVKLPQIIMANIEIFNESGFRQFVDVELEFIKPKSEDEKPVFTLSCPKFKRYLDEATKHEVEQLKEKLDDYLIVAGSI